MKKVMKLVLSAVTAMSLVTPFTMVSATEASNTMNSSSSNSSIPAKKNLTLPQIDGEQLNEEESLKVLESINGAMSKAESFNLKTVIEISNNTLGGPIENTGTVFPGKGEAYLNQNIGGTKREVYIKDGKIYLANAEGKWHYRGIDIKNYFGDLLNLNKSMLIEMDVYKLADGTFAIKTKENSAKPASSNTSNTSSNSVAKPANSKIEVLYIVDSEYKIVSLSGLTSTTAKNNEGESVMKTLAVTTFSDYNSAPAIEFPNGLENAELFPMTSVPASNNSNTSNTSNTSVPQ